MPVISKSLKQDPETYAIIGAAMSVHRSLGCGFLEAVYQEALEKEFILKNIPYNRECKLNINYKDMPLETYYKSDFICFDTVIVELKALSFITSKEESQVINYSKATGLRKALLLNFGARSLQYKRFVYGGYKPSSLEE